MCHAMFLNAAPLTSCSISVLLSSVTFSSTVGGGMGGAEVEWAQGEGPIVAAPTLPPNPLSPHWSSFGDQHAST